MNTNIIGKKAWMIIWVYINEYMRLISVKFIINPWVSRNGEVQKFPIFVFHCISAGFICVLIIVIIFFYFSPFFWKKHIYLLSKVFIKHSKVARPKLFERETRGGFKYALAGNRDKTTCESSSPKSSRCEQASSLFVFPIDVSQRRQSLSLIIIIPKIREWKKR